MFGGIYAKNFRRLQHLKDKYNIYAIALSAHTEESVSEFISADIEVEEIIQYFQKQNINTIDALCGFSFGGKIAYEIWQDGRLTICNLISFTWI